MKSIDRILWLAYGNHTQTSEYRELAEVVLDRLRRDGEVEKQELMREIGLDPSSESDDQKFKRLMRPLKGNKESNPLDVQFVVNDRRGQDSVYSYNRHTFRNGMSRVKQSIEHVMESEPDAEKQELKQKLEKKERKIERLEERVDEFEDDGAGLPGGLDQ